MSESNVIDLQSYREQKAQALASSNDVNQSELDILIQGLKKMVLECEMMIGINQ